LLGGRESDPTKGPGGKILETRFPLNNFGQKRKGKATKVIGKRRGRGIKKKSRNPGEKTSTRLSRFQRRVICTTIE